MFHSRIWHSNCSKFILVTEEVNEVPKDLDEFRKLQDVSERHGGRKITEGWEEIAKRICETGLAYKLKKSGSEKNSLTNASVSIAQRTRWTNLSRKAS